MMIEGCGYKRGGEYGGILQVISLHLKKKKKPYPKITEINFEVNGICLGGENV